MLVTFVGCSGAGKNTIITDLLGEYPEEYGLLPTLTTRAIRPGESEGNPYYFVSKEEFLRQIDEGTIYEYQQIHEGEYYGGSRKVLAKALATGKTLLKDIDILGSATYKEKLSDQFKVLSLFLYVDEEELIRRLHARGDKEESIQARVSRFPLEISLSGTSDYMVNNLSREATGAIARALLTAEKKEIRYTLAADCPLPTAQEVEKAMAQARSETGLAPVEMGFNGRQILIVEGAERYAAALKSGAFVQKKFSSLPDEGLKANQAAQAAWMEMIG